MLEAFTRRAYQYDNAIRVMHILGYLHLSIQI
jgi:hypothetical protein